jgi:hypothetical protein
VPGLAAYRRRWGARVWCWFSSPVLCCAVLSSNAVAQYHAAQSGRTGNKQATKSRSRFEAITGKGSVCISPENGGGRAGQVGWRRMPPVCVGSGLQLKTWVSAVAAVLCFAAEKRLSAASKRANQQSPSPEGSSNLIQPPKQFEAETRDLSASQVHLAEVLCSCDC